MMVLTIEYKLIGTRRDAGIQKRITIQVIQSLIPVPRSSRGCLFIQSNFSVSIMVLASQRNRINQK